MFILKQEKKILQQQHTEINTKLAELTDKSAVFVQANKVLQICFFSLTCLSHKTHTDLHLPNPGNG